MLISVCFVVVKPHKTDTIKKFGLIQCESSHTIADIYSFVSKGVLSSGDNFLLPREYEDAPVTAEIGDSLNPTATFQPVPLHLRIDGAAAFGKYLRFILKVDTEELSSNSHSVVPNAFTHLMTAHRKKVWPNLKSISRPNAKFQLHNSIVAWLQDLRLGWELSCRSFGEQFVTTLCDVLWMIDPHRGKLGEQGCSLPQYWDRFQGANIPSTHKHIAKSLSQDELTTSSQQLFNILEQVDSPSTVH